ncbi:MAG: YceI family protein [Chloroflexi bacterium]|nr:YceI family protein [Chloroflexota bacterium]MBP8057568.1 YceI family protein [Chloroflexota bacterium]
MKKSVMIGGIVVVLLVAILAFAFLREPESASEPIAAVPISETAGETSLGAEGAILFQISSADSEVRFQLDEDLRGNRVTVVGRTDQVAGEISLDLNNLSATQVGVIQINARTLATDNNMRNRALSNQILDTGSYEYITFTPTAVNGLPATASVGNTVSFTIDGDLTIRDVTSPATFTVEATVVSATQISGTATSVVTRETYGLTIPNVPNVANVEDEVELTIDFVANAS